MYWDHALVSPCGQKLGPWSSGYRMGPHLALTWCRLPHLVPEKAGLHLHHSAGSVPEHRVQRGGWPQALSHSPLGETGKLFFWPPGSCSPGPPPSQKNGFDDS